MKPVTQEKINHATEYTKIPQNPYTDKVVDVTVVTGEIVTLMQAMQRVGGEFGLDLRYSESAY